MAEPGQFLDTDRHQRRTERSEKQEDHNNNDEQRLRKSAEHFVDSILNVRGRVVRYTGFHARRQLRLDLRQRRANVLDHLKGIGSRENPDTHERRGLPVEANVLFVVLRAQHNVGNLA